MSNSKKSVVRRETNNGRGGERKAFREKVRERVWRHLDKVSSKHWQHSEGPDWLFSSFSRKQSHNEAVAKGLARGRRPSQNNRDPTVYSLLGGGRNLGLYFKMRSHWRFQSIHDTISIAFQRLPLAATGVEWSWGPVEGGGADSLLQWVTQHTEVV